MTRPEDAFKMSVPPSMAEMLDRYLRRRVSLQAMGTEMADTDAEVVPFEAVAVQPIDASLAWREATAALSHFHPNQLKGVLSAPPEWAMLTTACGAALAVPFAIGNYPQRVRNLQPLLAGGPLSALRPTPDRPVAVPELADWVAQFNSGPNYLELLVAISALRLAGQFEGALELVARYRDGLPAEWQPAWANEEAALAWQSARAEEAVDLWRAQPPSVPVLFNRGMSALFFDRAGEARTALTGAVAKLATDGAWYHLGSLYLALAEMRA